MFKEGDVEEGEGRTLEPSSVDPHPSPGPTRPDLRPDRPALTRQPAPAAVIAGGGGASSLTR